MPRVETLPYIDLVRNGQRPENILNVEFCKLGHVDGFRLDSAPSNDDMCYFAFGSLRGITQNILYFFVKIFIKSIKVIPSE
jgi:hypothetical protein